MTMRHVFKRGPGRNYRQCTCLWCGGRPGFSADCGATLEMRARVADFAAANDRTWKSKLRELWLQGKDEGLLRQARNVIGPSGLDRISAKMLADAYEREHDWDNDEDPTATRELLGEARQLHGELVAELGEVPAAPEVAPADPSIPF